MFTGAREIQNWLTNTAKEIARSKSLSAVEALERELATTREKGDKHADKTAAAAGDGESTTTASAAAAAADAQRRSKTALRRMAKRIRQGETLVIWTTPLGLPIVQPYRRRHVRQIRTSLQMIQVNDPAQQTAVHVTRQRSAFPPNFIHSLDSTHMLMTALACRRLKVRRSLSPRRQRVASRAHVRPCACRLADLTGCRTRSRLRRCTTRTGRMRPR